jgi:hypothetical protein
VGARRPPVDRGFWQGAHWRRACRVYCTASVWFVIICSWLNNGFPGVSAALVSLGCFGSIFLASELAFARKAGFEITNDRLILVGPLRRVEIRWSRVQGFTWRENFSLSRGKYLCVETDQKVPRRIPSDAPVRVPTVACVFDARRLNDRLLGPLVTSSRVRSKYGSEVEVIELLERARAQALANSPIEV